jgi:hypothetical protein
MQLTYAVQSAIIRGYYVELTFLKELLGLPKN